MTLICYLLAFALGCTLGRFVKLPVGGETQLARAYLALSILAVAVTFVFYFAGIRNAVAMSSMTFFLKWGKLLWYLALGYLAALLAAKAHTQKAFGPLLWGTAVTVAGTFITATIGKTIYIAQMKDFFHQSGYPIFFLYFIMSAESAGAAGVLAHRWLRTGPWAAIGLFVIMLGAVCTHLRNRDPFSDSYAALAQIITLSILLFLYRFERKQKSSREVLGQNA